MKKIMFNDKCGLTDAVLQGRKTMTRRAVQGKYLRIYEDMSRLGQPCHPLEEWLLRKAAAYKVDEVIAVAQSYKDLGYTKGWVEQHIRPNPNANCNDPFEKKYPGWSNKMFVPAELNKAHKIRITDIKVERLQDISDIDCANEGIRYYLNFSEERIARFYIDAIPNYHPGAMATYDSVREAFADLIDKVSGKGTWEWNPYVFAYTFELVR